VYTTIHWILDQIKHCGAAAHELAHHLYFAAHPNLLAALSALPEDREQLDALRARPVAALQNARGWGYQAILASIHWSEILLIIV
jgi:hypothetical protein